MKNNKKNRTFFGDGGSIFLLFRLLDENWGLKFDDERLSRCECEVFRQVVFLSSDDVLRLALELVGVEKFLVAADFEHGRLRRAVENGHHGVAMPATGEHIDAFPRAELGLVAANDGFVAIAPVKQVR